MSKHITTTRDRQSRKYKALHRQLRAEIESDGRIRSLDHLSDHQRDKFATHELYMMIGETSP